MAPFAKGSDVPTTEVELLLGHRSNSAVRYCYK